MSTKKTGTSVTNSKEVQLVYFVVSALFLALMSLCGNYSVL